MRWLIEIAPILDALAKIVTALMALLAFLQAWKANKKLKVVQHQTNSLVEQLREVSVQQGRQQVHDEIAQEKKERGY